MLVLATIGGGLVIGLSAGLLVPVISVVLTKLGYLIENPWNNALNCAHAAGAVLGLENVDMTDKITGHMSYRAFYRPIG